MSAFPTDDQSYDAIYAEEAAMIDAGELLADALERSGMSRAALAKALGVSRGEVTNRLSGDRNITVRKLAATLHALGSKLELRCAEEQVKEATNDLALITYVHLYKPRDSHRATKRASVPREPVAVGAGAYLKAMSQ
jgi:transcriptional regulator with XRE-family HTH domain